MYKKYFYFINFLLIAILFYFAYQFYILQDIKLVINEKLVLLQKAADHFSFVGKILCVVVFLICNIKAFFEKKAIWVCSALLYFVLVVLLNAYQQEYIFILKKQNGISYGSFSITYLAAIFFIAIAIVVSLVNYFIMKFIIKKRIS